MSVGKKLTSREKGGKGKGKGSGDRKADCRTWIGDGLCNRDGCNFAHDEHKKHSNSSHLLANPRWNRQH